MSAGNAIDLDMLGIRMVLVSMECQRLVEQNENLRSSIERQTFLLRDRDILKAEVENLKRTEATRADFETSNLKLTKELLSMQENARVKEERIRKQSNKEREKKRKVESNLDFEDEVEDEDEDENQNEMNLDTVTTTREKRQVKQTKRYL